MGTENWVKMTRPRLYKGDPYGPRRLCACGCGELTSPGRRLLHGHGTLGRIIPPSESRRRSITRQGSELSEETKENMSIAQQGLTRSDSVREQMSKITRELWQDPEYRNNQLESRQKRWLNFSEDSKNRQLRAMLMGTYTRPSKPEQVLIDIVRDFGFPFEYNGSDGKLMVGGLCPDFRPTNGIKLVLLEDGVIYHGNPFREARIDKTYKEHGYRTFHITDLELYDMVDYEVAALINLKLKEVKQIGN